MCGIEAGEISQEIAERVADLPVGLGVAVQDLLGKAHVLEEVDHRHPQPEDLRTALVGDLEGRDHVAQRLRHLPAFAVHREAVRDDTLVRRAPSVVRGDEQRRVEPAAVLIVPLEVEVGGPGEPGVAPEHRAVRYAGFEPDVHDVIVNREA